MFFDDIKELPRIAQQTHCSIFVVDPETPLNLRNALYLRPQSDKVTISVEQVRNFLALAKQKQTTARFLVIAPADKLSPSASNALLKTLEETTPHHHFLLLTQHPSVLLPTILSRAQLYLPKPLHPLDAPPKAAPAIKQLAKRLIAAQPTQLIQLANEITASPGQSREYSLSVVATAIEILYKAYFQAPNPKFLQKIAKLLVVHQNITANGHIKLHIVADML